MAGVGSGWFERRSSRMRTDDYPSIDVRHLRCNSRLDKYVVLTGSTLAVLEWRPCHFGGYRPYFQCPRCQGRCCILYRFRGEGKGYGSYGCQKCLGMVHPVENEGGLERMVRRNNKAFVRQRYDPAQPQGKPLWMRWPTWSRLSEEVAKSAIARFEYHDKMLELLAYLEKPKPPREASSALSVEVNDQLEKITPQAHAAGHLEHNAGISLSKFVILSSLLGRPS